MAELTSPRESFNFEQAEGPDQAFASAYEKNRLHHAWLLCGPQGLGKASFAFRCARFLMGHDRDPRFGTLGMSPEDADVRLITAGSHPDLLVLEREMGETKLKKNISVDAVREIGERNEQNVAWAWGVNGAASVVGSCLVMVVIVFLETRSALLLGAACYALAALMSFRRKTAGAAVLPEERVAAA